MESTSSACHQLLHLCLRGEPWTEELLDRALAEREGLTFLSVVIEQLSDLFKPRLAETYNRLFTQVIGKVAPELMPRVRSAPVAEAAPANVERVYVLSRVTLGADVAVTSVLLDGAKRRYPDAQIIFVGSRKSYEMFEADPRVTHFPAPYARGGSLADRLRASASLRIEDGLVLDPDSRLTQLGLVSICDENNYFFFPSRSYGGDSLDSLPTLAARWAKDVLGVDDAAPFVAPRISAEPPADITVSLGVGENNDKRVSGDFETELLRALVETGRSVVVDLGGDAQERARVEKALPAGVRTHDGSFASFASLIQQSKLYVGYDSAGGHVASACGVPLISIARGFLSERMAARWRPKGVVLDGNRPDLLVAIKQSLGELLLRK